MELLKDYFAGLGENPRCMWITPFRDFGWAVEGKLTITEWPLRGDGRKKRDCRRLKEASLK